MSQVLILGGGFGGLAAASEIRRLLPDAEVVLVDRIDRFFMGFAKLWDLAGIRPLEEGTASLGELEHRGVRFVQAEITQIDPAGREVETSAGTLEADALLVALGAVPSPPHRQMLERPGAFDLYNAGQLPAIRQSLQEIEGGGVLVAILGGPFKCPPAPFEAVLVVDELLRSRGVRGAMRLAIATPQPMTLPVAGRDASQYVAAHLEARGIELLAQHVVQDVDADRRAVHFRDGSEFEYEVLLGVPACAPPRVVRESPLAAASGWIEPDRSTFRTAFERVYAVGDCTLVPTAKFQLPKAGVFAAAEGEVAARNIVRDLVGGEESHFDGHGFCFLELPGRKVAFVEGDFYAEPVSDVRITKADEAQFQRKQEYEQARLAAWLG